MNGLHDWFTLTRTADRQRRDVEALERGDKRVVRCYVQPAEGERRKHWKPGVLLVSRYDLRWKGSSRRWNPFTLKAQEWFTNVRTPTRDDGVFNVYRIIVCSSGTERHELAVPRQDADLCLAALRGWPARDAAPGP